MQETNRNQLNNFKSESICNRGATHHVWRSSEIVVCVIVYTLIEKSKHGLRFKYIECLSSIEHSSTCMQNDSLIYELCLFTFILVRRFYVRARDVTPDLCAVFFLFIQFHFNGFVSSIFCSHPFKTDQHLLQWHIRCVQIPWRRNKMLRLLSSRLQWARILLCLQSTLYRRRRFRVKLLMPNFVYLLSFPTFPITYIDLLDSCGR